MKLFCDKTYIADCTKKILYFIDDDLVSNEIITNKTNIKIVSDSSFSHYKQISSYEVPSEDGNFVQGV